MERVETWIETYSPEELIASRDGAAFHLYHARVVAGNGGLLGRGLGNGVASKTGLLPERDSDSIFMVVAEEGGFIGAAGIIVLYVMMSALLLLSASGMRDRFARLGVGGVGIYFAAHLLINVSVNVGLLPMTGLTLPLFSTGGSSLLATFLALGLAVGMAAHKESRMDEDAFKSY
jgi:rod shape determining protein RodA